MHDTYLGHTAEYWLELDKKARELNADKLLQENVTLRGQLAFIEDRITQINLALK